MQLNSRAVGATVEGTTMPELKAPSRLREESEHLGLTLIWGEENDEQRAGGNRHILSLSRRAPARERP